MSPKTKKELFPKERAMLRAFLRNYTEMYPNNVEVFKVILTQEEFRKAETIFRKNLSLQGSL